MKKGTKNTVSSVSINNKHKDNKNINIKEFPNVQKKALTEAQIATITKEIVIKLNWLETKNIEGWLEMGKVVHDFVYKIHPKGQYRSDPYQILALHPDSCHRSSQLRNYEACWGLYTKLGGNKGAPKVSMTHLIQVLPLKINVEAKRKLLLMAEQEKWSVSEFKAHLKGKSGSDQKPVVIHNYGKDLQDCLRNMVDLVSRITIKDKLSISPSTRMQIVSSVQHLVTLGVITFEEINAPDMKKAA